MDTVLVRWQLVYLMVAIFSISAVGQMVCGKSAGYSHATVPSDTTSTGRGHPNLGSLPPNTALENVNVSALLTDTLEKNGISMPEGGLKSACSRFKDLSQCIAAMHVAKNLNLSFGDLQSKMTGSNPMNVDKAILSLAGHEVNAKNQAKKAKKHTNQDLKMAEPRA